VDALDRIRLKAATIVEGKFDQASADRAYAALFRERGLAVEGEDPGAVADWVRASALRSQLVAALDDWAVATRDSARRGWLLEVARQVEPSAWGDRFRDPAVWGKRAALEQLARDANVAELSPQLLAALGWAMLGTGADPVPLLTAAQECHPADFWLNLLLGKALSVQSKRGEAAEFYRAALAVRPETGDAYNDLAIALHDKGRLDDAIQACRKAIALDPKDALPHTNLGRTLEAKGRLDEAIEEYRKAVALAPKDAVPHYNLGIALQRKRLPDEAIEEYRRAIALDPKHPGAHGNLGHALKDKGRLDEAIEEYHKVIALAPKDAKAHGNLGHALKDKDRLDDAIREYRKAIELDPKEATAHYNLGIALKAKGLPDEAIEEYRKAIDLNPKLAEAHSNLGGALLGKGRPDEAIEQCRKAILLNPKLAQPHYHLGNALLGKGRLDDAIQAFRKAVALDPKLAVAHTSLGAALGLKGRLDESIEHCRQAVALAPKYAPAHANLGNALSAKGRLDEAVTAFRKAIALDPKLALAHGALGEALLKQGRFAEAQAATRRCLDLLPRGDLVRWPVTQQLRQCERLLALDEKLPALLKGEAKPAGAAERLALAQLCQLPYKQLYATSARFYAEAFADQPRLAEDLRASHRYNAACAATLAGAGQGRDAGKLGDKEKARLRQQALDWLRADLTSHGKQLKSWWPGAADQARQALTHWRKDPDLAGLRDQQALAKLPQAERQAWRKLWADVDALLQRGEQNVKPAPEPKAPDRPKR
jgi:tetratricopeptide (TPR) repeat protein